MEQSDFIKNKVTALDPLPETPDFHKTSAILKQHKYSDGQYSLEQVSVLILNKDKYSGGKYSLQQVTILNRDKYSDCQYSLEQVTTLILDRRKYTGGPDSNR